MKKIYISLIFVLNAFVIFGQYTVTLELQESTTGGCGSVSDCSTNTICYDLYGTPSVDGAWLASYDIWFLINGATGSSVLYESDATCIITDNTDLPSSGATTFIRVGASQGNTTDILTGSTLLHNFCMTYTNLDALNMSTLDAGGSFAGFNSNMSVNVSGVPTNAVIVPTTLTFSSANNSCLLLPVNWLSFEAEKFGKSSRLTWTTGAETNNAGFEIERSADGQHFEMIGVTPASHAPREINSYSFTDDNPYAGKNYYRLKQIDLDGRFEYSPVRSLRFNDQKLSVKVWPNPVGENLTIEFSEPSEGGEIKIVNSTGTVVRKTFEQFDEQISLDMTLISPGMYSIIIESIHSTYLEKIVVLR